MLLMSRIMGCGHSKQHSPNMSKVDGLLDGHLKEKPYGKKNKQHVDKENLEPVHVELQPINVGHFPKMAKDKHTSPHLTNRSKPHTLHLNADLPHFKDKTDLSPTQDNEVKEFTVPRQNIKVTHSQLEFFKMLDEKIEQGPDYTSRDNSVIDFIKTPSP